MWLGPTGNCACCGISDGMHVSGCPNRPRKPDVMSPPPMKNRDYGPSPYEPPPDKYVSPHSIEWSKENPLKTPVFKYTEDENGMIHAFHTGERYDYPHRDWVEAREAYATDPEKHPLDTVLMHVTETNPPAGPPIPVYKAPQPRQPDRARTIFFAAFAFLFVMAGLLPFLVTLFG